MKTTKVNKNEDLEDKVDFYYSLVVRGLESQDEETTNENVFLILKCFFEKK
jgi:hypothetical protein